MRILVVSNMFPSDASPGYGVFVRNYVEALARLDGRLRVQVVAIRDARHGLLSALGKYGRFGVSSVAALARFRPDVVHCHYALPTALPIWALRLIHRRPYVVTVHGGDLYDMCGRVPQGVQLLRRVLRRARHVIAVGRELAVDVRRMCLGLGLPPLSVINMGVDVKRFAPVSPMPPLHQVALVGHLIPRKGVDVAVSAIAAVSGASLHVFGEGPEKARLRAQAVALRCGERVHFHGALPQAQLAVALRRCGVLLAPPRREPFGLVALEGMAMGMVVIASRVGGLAETVQPGVNGFLFESGDAVGLAALLRRAIGLDGASRQRLATAARQTAAANSLTTQAAKNLRILRSVVQKPD